MNTQEAYRQKIEAELDLARAKLAEFKTQPRSLTAEDRIQHIRRIEELEQRVVAAKAKWQELAGASDDVWHQMKAGAESTWKALQDEIEEAITDVQS
jgi:hypothetical protein